MKLLELRLKESVMEVRNYVHAQWYQLLDGGRLYLVLLPDWDQDLGSDSKDSFVLTFYHNNLLWQSLKYSVFLIQISWYIMCFCFLPKLTHYLITRSHYAGSALRLNQTWYRWLVMQCYFRVMPFCRSRAGKLNRYYKGSYVYRGDANREVRLYCI